MPPTPQGHPSALLAPNGEVGAKLLALRPGAAVTLIGLRQAQLGQVLSGVSSAPSMLRLDLAGVATTALAIDRVLDDLADLAAAQWPDWNPPDTEKSPRLLPAWRLAATRFASEGRRPRFPRLARETEFVHLLSVLPDLALLAEVDSLRSERAAPIIAALEWCRRHGAAVVAMLGEEPAPEPPWDLLLYDAVMVEPSPVEPAAHRLILSPSSDIASRGSTIERRMREALRAAPDLAGLFEDEVTLRLGALGLTPRVDLLWREGKVVVELDGPEHERDPNYGADRHRDYELLVAGYLVLRLTNAEVQLDLGRSLEKVRRVVSLTRGQP
jgi:hypothetical protein